MSSRARVAFTCAAVVVNLRPLCAGPVCVAVRVETGHGVYKGHEVVPCDASMHVLQKAEGLLWPEKARFHKVACTQRCRAPWVWSALVSTAAYAEKAVNQS